MFYSSILLLLLPLFTAYSSVIIRNSGDNVTFKCFHSPASKVSWYKQVVGQTPQLIYSVYGSAKHFYNDFENDQRFTANSDSEHLMIFDLQPWDSAMYYCGQTSVGVTQFQKGSVLFVQASNPRLSSVLQHQSVSVSPGESIQLNCSVNPGIIDVDSDIYWFWKDVRDSQPGILLIDWDTRPRCLRGSGSCEGELWRRNVKYSDAGDYYCAVASCGEVVFGARTKLLVEGSSDHRLWLVLLPAALLLSVTANILTCVLCAMSRRKQIKALEHARRVYDVTEEQEEDLQYVAIEFRKRQSTRASNREHETVYSGVA